MGNSSIKRVLVVDDEEGYRRLVQEYLQTLDFDCRVAADAAEALHELNRETHELVISDIRMPGKTGLELSREALRLYPHLDIIITTGHPSDYTYSDIIDAGAADFIVKPFDMAELKAKIERIDRERRIVSDLHATNRALALESAVNSSIAKLSKALINSVSVDEISELVLWHAMQLTDSEIGFVGYIDRDSGSFVAPTMTGKVWDQCSMERKNHVFEKFGGLWGWVLDNQKSIVTNDLQKDPRSSGVPAGHLPIERFLSVPAIVDEQLVGQIALANAARDYTERELSVIEQLAAIYALRVRRRWNVEDLLRAKNHLEHVFDNSVEAISFVDRHGRPVKWNKVASETFGYSEEEMKGKKVFDLYPDKDALGRMLNQLRRHGFVKRHEIDMKRKDGRIAPFEVSIRLLKSKEGETMGSVAVAMDLSDLKKAMADLKQANEQLHEEITERKRIAEQLNAAQGQLKQMLEDRTEKLSRAGEIMKRSIDRFKSIAEE